MAASRCLYGTPARAGGAPVKAAPPPPTCRSNPISCKATADGLAPPPLRTCRRLPISCKATDGLKSKAPPPKQEGAEKAVVERLERIFRHSENNPRAPGSAAREGKPVRVAYQGEWGSYCHEAAVRAFERCDAVPCGGGMAAAFEAIESGAAERAVVPVENSLDGVIDRNFDLLLRHPRVQIVGELLLPINHCLLGVNGMDLKRVVSHPQALDHCRRRLRRLGVEVEAVENPATAARFVAENEVSDTAVIGSMIAGREFGLRVVEENMQDDSSNTTRFFLLGNSKIGSSSSKTTVAFSLEGGAADLYKALSIFALKGIKDALEQLKGITHFFRVLGSYNSHS
ncbi:hypothetical protein SUGI_0585720 [Cryptomeria japonica]|nr:hypothetical protein SUGI_0585720 [Cryptomeria japonica]